MVKLGVFDLDGTLLTGGGRLPETFREDMELLRSRNVSVAIASARPAQFLFEMFDGDTDLLISGEDGNIFFRGRQLLHARYLSPELAARVYAIAAERDDMAVMCTGPEGLYVSAGHYDRFIRWGKGQFMPEAPREPAGDEKICKIHVFCRDGIGAAKQMASTVFGGLRGDAEATESGYGWIGITGKGSDKASAVRFFQQYLGIGVGETAVFGDSPNDIPMFGLAGYAFAMKNAPPEVQEKAGFITEEDNNHNGAVKALIGLTDPGSGG